MKEGTDGHVLLRVCTATSWRTVRYLAPPDRDDHIQTIALISLEMNARGKPRMTRRGWSLASLSARQRVFGRPGCFRRELWSGYVDTETVDLYARTRNEGRLVDLIALQRWYRTATANQRASIVSILTGETAKEVACRVGSTQRSILNVRAAMIARIRHTNN